MIAIRYRLNVGEPFQVFKSRTKHCSIHYRLAKLQHSSQSISSVLVWPRKWDDSINYILVEITPRLHGPNKMWQIANPYRRQSQSEHIACLAFLRGLLIYFQQGKKRELCAYCVNFRLRKLTNSLDRPNRDTRRFTPKRHPRLNEQITALRRDFAAGCCQLNLRGFKCHGAPLATCGRSTAKDGRRRRRMSII